LEQEISVHIKVIAKVNDIDYEMPFTSGIRGRRKLALEESSESAKTENQKNFDKLLAFLN
jgi:hypothetical protein